MTSLEPEQFVIGGFTSQQWSGRPAKDGCAMFVGFGILGFVLCLVLMLFIPPLRDAGVAALFIVVVSIVLTVMAIRGKSSSEAAFLRTQTSQINETIRELTGYPNDQFSTESFRAFVEKGQSIPLLVNGVAGIDFRAIRESEVKIAASASVEPQQGVKDWRSPGRSAKPPEPVTTTRFVLTVTPPDYGTDSFDRLLSAALKTFPPE